MSAPRRELLLLRAVQLLACALVFDVAFELGTLDSNARATLASLADGTAHRPFQFRVLVPAVARALAALIPEAAVSALPAPLHGYVERLGGDALALGGVLVMAGSLLGFVFVLEAFSLRVLSTSRERAALFTVGVTLGLVPFLFWAYVYDFTTLLVFTAAGWLLSERRWRAFGVVCLLACLTRETAVLLVLPAVLVADGPRARPRVAALVLVTYLGIQLAIRLAFRDAPGTPMEDHLAGNLAEIRANPGVVACLLLFAGGLAWRIRRAWPLVDGAVRGQVLGGPVLLMAALLGGMWAEARVLLEAYPATALALAASCMFREGERKSPGRDPDRGGGDTWTRTTDLARMKRPL